MDGDVAEQDTRTRPVEDRAVVLGFGNILQKDDGIGVHALRWLQADLDLAGC